MNDLLSEKEQIDQLRSWWSEYGNYVIVGVALGVLGLFGWNYQRTSTAEAEQAASALYDTLAGHVDNGELDEAESVARQITAEYGDTAYAAQSKLAMARLYMDNNRDQDAVDVLSALLALRGYPELQHIGRIRLAKVLLYQDQPEEALALLEGEDSDAFAARYAEVRGDAHAALNRYDEARAEYQRALEASQLEAALTGSTPSVGTGFIQLKLLDLPFDAPESDLPESDLSQDEPPTTDASSAAGTDGMEAGDSSIDNSIANSIDNNAGESTDTSAGETVDDGVEPGEPVADEEPLQ